MVRKTNSQVGEGFFADIFSGIPWVGPLVKKGIEALGGKGKTNKRKISPALKSWIARVKKHASDKNITYKQAMIDLKGTN